MGRLASKSLSAKRVETESRLGYHADGPNTGLYLQVAQGTRGVTRSWVYRYTSPTLKRRREVGLGSIGVRKLADARSLAAEYRQLVLGGLDPKDERDRIRAQNATTRLKRLPFDEAAAQCIAAREPEWRSAKHGQQWRCTLATYVSPIIGTIPVDQLTITHVLKVLQPIWTEKTETASRIRQRIEAVLDWAKAGGYRTGDNPASLKGGLGQLLPSAGKVKKVTHHAALDFRLIHDFVGTLQSKAGVAPLAFEFLILTAARTKEVTGAKWDEIDFVLKRWTVPKERMKAGKEHIVPLSARALSILKAAQATASGEYVFASPARKTPYPLSNAAFLAIMKKLDRFAQYTPHGMRSTFREWAGETNFPREVIEHALAHQLKDKAEAAYARGTLLTKRAKLMDQWAQFVATPPKSAQIAVLKTSYA
ncbi:MAG: tyrosine-type recombinase/integrase [Pseudomonadota bacterium]